MDLANIDYNVNGTENCVLINTREWLYPDNTLILKYKMSGRTVITYLNKALKVNVDTAKFPTHIGEGQSLLLSQIVSSISMDREHKIEGNYYYNVPITQVMGYFVDNKITYDNLIMLYDKILVEKVNIHKDELIKRVDDNTMVGKVLKVGTNAFDKNWKPLPLRVSVGDTVLIRDNATTLITLNNKEYYAIEHGNIIGKFHDSLSMNSIEVINDYMIMHEYVDELKIDDSIISTRLDSYEGMDWSSYYNDSIFIVIHKDKNLTKVNIGDKVVVNRHLVNYAYFNNVRYNVISGLDYIEAKIA